MIRFKPALIAAASLAALTVTGCVTDPETGNQRISRAAIGGVLGAAGGYLLGRAGEQRR